MEQALIFVSIHAYHFNHYPAHYPNYHLNYQPIYHIIRQWAELSYEQPLKQYNRRQDFAFCYLRRIAVLGIRPNRRLIDTANPSVPILAPCLPSAKPPHHSSHRNSIKCAWTSTPPQIMPRRAPMCSNRLFLGNRSTVLASCTRAA